MTQAKFTAAILWGGQSSRMGQDKGFLPLHTTRVIEGMIDILRPLFDELILVTHHADYRNIKVTKIITDEIPGRGPLEGLKMSLQQASHSRVLVAACDAPFLNASLIHLLLRRSPYQGCVISETGGKVHPFPGVYSKSLLPLVQDSLNKNELKMTSFCDKVKAQILPEEKVREVDPQLHSYINLNTPDDYYNALKVFKNSPP